LAVRNVDSGWIPEWLLLAPSLAKTDISNALFSMAVTLLALSDGRSSLELSPEDSAAVREAVAALFGGIAERLSASYSTVTFAGESFLMEWEWDEPCLIATNARGSELLSQIEKRLNG
jgi:hypothetical protein